MTKEEIVEAVKKLSVLELSELVKALETEFGVEYTLTGAYELLHRLGLSCLRPRPRHRKSDPQAQKQWLDRAPFLSRKYAKNTRKNK